MRYALVLALLALATTVAAQESVDRAAIARINDEGLNRSQVGELFNHLTNVIGPRLTGSPAFKRAVDWSADRLTRFGLANVHTEAWPFGRGWTLERLTLEITEPRYFPLSGYPEAWTPSTKGELLGTPAYIGDLTADQVRSRKAELAGQMVLPWKPQPAFITAAREKFSVYFNHDPGTGPIYGWYLEENEAVRPIFDAWLEPLEDIGARRNIVDRIGSTDHLAFIAAGLPGFNTVQDYTDYDTRTHHTNTDFYERLKLDDLKQAAVVLATFAYQAAMRDEKIPRAARPVP